MGYYAERSRYSPIVLRPRVSWPDGARVALWVAPNIEHTEYLPPPNEHMNPWPRTPHPDIREYAFHDYGNRVAFWRLLKVLDRQGIRATVSLNAGVLEHFPEITQAMVERDWDYMLHGLFNTRYLYGASEEDERAFYDDCLATVRKHTGKTPMGMLGPAITGTVRTPDLMAEAGMVYHADWIHDDQPVPLQVSGGRRMITMPYSFELNDGPLLKSHIEGPEWAEMCKAQFDRLYRDGEQTGMVMALSVHPFRIAQAARVDYFESVLEYVRKHDDVWLATGDEIAQHYLDHCYDDMVAHQDEMAEYRSRRNDAG
jgi:allantoinase